MRRAAKVDANHAAIVKDLREIPGVTAYSTAGVGSGFPDIAVGWRGVSFFFELKDGNKPPSDRKLTPAQQKFHQTWTGHVATAESLDDVLKVIGL